MLSQNRSYLEEMELHPIHRRLKTMDKAKLCHSNNQIRLPEEEAGEGESKLPNAATKQNNKNEKGHCLQGDGDGQFIYPMVIFVVDRKNKGCLPFYQTLVGQKCIRSPSDHKEWEIVNMVRLTNKSYRKICGNRKSQLTP